MGARREKHQPLPCSQQESSFSWASQRRERTLTPWSRLSARASSSLIAGSRAPSKSTKKTEPQSVAAKRSALLRVRYAMAPGPRVGVSGKRSLPSGLRAASHAGRGCVAPALTTITSAGSNGPRAPSAWIDGDLRPGLERDAGTIGESLVDFDGDDAAVRADKFGEDGRVIAGATAEMKNVVAGMNVEQAQDEWPTGWADRCSGAWPRRER